MEKIILFLGPHVCYVMHVLYNGNLCIKSSVVNMIEKQMKQSKKGECYVWATCRLS